MDEAHHGRRYLDAWRAAFPHRAIERRLKESPRPVTAVYRRALFWPAADDWLRAFLINAAEQALEDKVRIEEITPKKRAWIAFCFQGVGTEFGRCTFFVRSRS